MSRYKKIDVRIYSDAAFRALSRPKPNGQTLFMFCLTGPFTTVIPGVFSGGAAAMAERLGWSLDGFREAFREVSGEAIERGCRKALVKADWAEHLVWVPNAIKYNIPESPNVIRSWGTVWDELPECALKVEAYQRLKAFLNDYSEAFGKAFVETCAEPSVKPSGKASPNQEQEQEQEQEEEGEKAAVPAAPPASVHGVPETRATAPWVIERWNAIAGVEPLQMKYYTPHAGVGKKLATRLNERKSKAWWEGFFGMVQQSTWLVEEFHPCLDWALGEKNIQKILQGNYLKTVQSKPKSAFGKILADLHDASGMPDTLATGGTA
jgi:hypothetical protein